MLYMCILPCKHTHYDYTTMYKKLAGFTLEDLGLVLYRQGKTHRRRQRRTCHGSQSG